MNGWHRPPRFGIAIPNRSSSPATTSLREGGGASDSPTLSSFHVNTLEAMNSMEARPSSSIETFMALQHKDSSRWSSRYTILELRVPKKSIFAQFFPNLLSLKLKPRFFPNLLSLSLA